MQPKSMFLYRSLTKPATRWLTTLAILSWVSLLALPAWSQVTNRYGTNIPAATSVQAGDSVLGYAPGGIISRRFWATNVFLTEGATNQWRADATNTAAAAVAQFSGTNQPLTAAVTNQWRADATNTAAAAVAQFSSTNQPLTAAVTNQWKADATNAAQTLTAAFSATNGNVIHLERFWTNLSQSGPLVVAALGDSVGAAKFYWLIEDLIARRGFAGYKNRGFTSGSTLGLYSTTESGTSSTAYRDAVWPLTHHKLTAANAVTFGKGSPQVAIYADTVEVFYLGGAGQGAFTVELSTNSAAWGNIDTIDASTNSATICRNAWTLAPNNYRMRLLATSGTNKVVGTSIYNSQSNGVVVAVLDNSPEGLDVGTGASGIFSGDTNALNSVLGWIAPDLLFTEFKDRQTLSDSNIAAGVTRLAGVLESHVPGSVVWIGTTPDKYRNEAVNFNLMSTARTYGQTYWEGAVPCISTNYMQSLGWANDFVHPTTNCQSYLARRMLDELGLDVVANGVVDGIDVTIQTNGFDFSALSTAAFTNGVAARLAVYTNGGTIYYLTLSTNVP